MTILLEDFQDNPNPGIDLIKTAAKTTWGEITTATETARRGEAPTNTAGTKGGKGATIIDLTTTREETEATPLRIRETDKGEALKEDSKTIVKNQKES